MSFFSLPKSFPLLPRKKETNKSHYGHMLVLAGSRGFSGASILTSLGALYSGSGLVTLGTPKSCQSIVSKRLVEVMTLGLSESSDGVLSLAAYTRIIEFIKKRRINVVAIGPGLSTHSSAVSLVQKLIKNLEVPVVLDADGLNSFVKKAALFRKKKAGLVLTPHQGEFERLFGEKWPALLARRIALAKKLSKFYDVVLVLKGPDTLVVSGNKVYKNNTGNPGMAKGGSGDVLTGMIAAFIGQGLSLFEASVWAVYFHGKAGDLAVKEKGELSLTATDLIRFLPQAFKQ